MAKTNNYRIETAHVLREQLLLLKSPVYNREDDLRVRDAFIGALIEALQTSGCDVEADCHAHLMWAAVRMGLEPHGSRGNSNWMGYLVVQPNEATSEAQARAGVLLASAIAIAEE